MSNKSQQNVWMGLLGLIALASLVYNVRLFLANKQLKSELPHLMVNESFGNFDLLDTNGTSIDRDYLDGERPLVLFLFERPCTPCNKNVAIWNHMASVLDERANFIGIIIGDPNAVADFSINKFEFKIFHPRNPELFLEKNRIRLNFAQTIVCKKTKVKYLKMGDLEAKETITIKNVLERL